MFIGIPHPRRKKQRRAIRLFRENEIIIKSICAEDGVKVLIARMLTSVWIRARRKVNLDVRVHDLRHTFGRRLRAAGVSFEDRQDLLGHKSGRITTHYSAAKLGNLVTTANKVCKTSQDFSNSTITLLRCTNVVVRFSAGKKCCNHHKIPTN